MYLLTKGGFILCQNIMKYNYVYIKKIRAFRRNEDVLNDCGFHGSFGYKKYTDQGYWTGLGYDDNCTDPKKLYENAMNRYCSTLLQFMTILYTRWRC